MYHTNFDISLLKKGVLMRIVLLTALILIPCFAQGSWEVIQQSPSFTPMGMCFLPDGQHGWAVGDSFIFRTTDGGTSWETLTISASSNAVCFTSPDSGWVVGDNGGIFATTDGGDNWSSQSSGTSRLLASVHFINHLEGWICGGWQSGGSSYLILHTTNGGVTWESQSFGSNAYSCEDIWFTDSMNGWVGGRTSTIEPHIHHTTDGGANWISQTIPVAAANIGICGIDFATPDIGWAATSCLTAGGPILYTDDGGDNWIVQTSSDLDYHRVDAKDENNVAVVAVRILSPAQVKVMVTSDGGQNWSSTILPLNDYTYAVQYVNNDIWTASNYSQIMHSTDNGTTWEWQHRSPYWKSISWVDDLTGRITSGSNAGTDGYSIISSDGGTTWDHDTDSPGGAMCFFTDPDTGWMLWEGTSSRIWKTIDGGTNWTQHFIGSGSWIGDIFFVSADSGWAFGSDGTLKFTSNGGVNWSSQPLGTSWYVASVHFVNASEGWAAGGFGGANGFIHHTTDGGATWTPQTPATSSHTLSLFFLNDQEGWAAGCSGRTQRTTDGGASWESTGTVPHEYIQKILMINSDTGWLAVSDPMNQGGRGHIYRTDDGGSSWTLEWSGTWYLECIADIQVQSDSIIWACGYHNTILKYVPPNGFESETSSPGAVLLHTAEPNPFSSSAVIRFATTLGGYVRLDLFDVSGRLVKTMLNGWIDAGAHQATLSGQELSPGMYIYRLHTEESVITEKCILLR